MLSGKETYLEWSRNIEHTLIFNDIWDGICDRDTSPTKPMEHKEISIWINKDKKAYGLIIAFLSEEVSPHIISNKHSWGDLKKLKYLYDSHSKLELIEFLLKLFNLELKHNDPMDLL